VRCKNFFALGLAYWMFNRTLDHTIAWIEQTMAKKDALAAQANLKALKAGHAYGETAEIFTHSYVIPEANIAPGKYKNITGNEATAMGLLAAMQLSGLDMFLGTYPITPATDILHHLSKYKHLGVKTFQAEDEIAGICSAIGASYAGGLAVTTTSGPGLALKSEAMNLALMIELPLVIVNVQRGGPSTGLPTKTEQSDLLQALFGRNGESPIPVIAAKQPRRLLRRRHRGRAHRHHVDDPRAAPDRWLPGQRLRALAHPAAHGPAPHPGALPHGAQRFPALQP
jgi:2-oxoglutarate ferredoxin oxidoreductase subunit alpha